MQKIAIMRQRIDLAGCCHRQIVGLYRVGRHDHPQRLIARIGAQLEVHGQLMDAQIGAVATDNSCAQIVMYV